MALTGPNNNNPIHPLRRLTGPPPPVVPPDPATTPPPVVSPTPTPDLPPPAEVRNPALPPQVDSERARQEADTDRARRLAQETLRTTEAARAATAALIRQQAAQIINQATQIINQNRSRAIQEFLHRAGSEGLTQLIQQANQALLPQNNLTQNNIANILGVLTVATNYLFPRGVANPDEENHNNNTVVADTGTTTEHSTNLPTQESRVATRPTTPVPQQPPPVNPLTAFAGRVGRLFDQATRVTREVVQHNLQTAQTQIATLPSAHTAAIQRVSNASGAIVQAAASDIVMNDVIRRIERHSGFSPEVRTTAARVIAAVRQQGIPNTGANTNV